MHLPAGARAHARVGGGAALGGFGEAAQPGMGLQKAAPSIQPRCQLPARSMNTTSELRCRLCCDALHLELGYGPVPRSCWHCVTHARRHALPLCRSSCPSCSLRYSSRRSSGGCCCWLWICVLRGAGVHVLWQPCRAPGTHRPAPNRGITLASSCRYCASYIPYGQSFIKRMLGFSTADADDG